MLIPGDQNEVTHTSVMHTWCYFPFYSALLMIPMEQIAGRLSANEGGVGSLARILFDITLRELRSF